MAIDTHTSDGSAGQDEHAVRERLGRFLMRNFPQIAMHGGDAAIEHLDLEAGEVWIRLGGACSGCGISPMTIQAIKRRLVTEIPEITTVHAEAGTAMPTPPTSSADDDGDPFPDAPF
ncbi:MAG: NifU family protein [Halobacteriales archaeon]|nr:NifU family protein [Halobacteriales archaeon]